jgi:hypothetical protein
MSPQAKELTCGLCQRPIPLGQLIYWPPGEERPTCRRCLPGRRDAEAAAILQARQEALARQVAPLISDGLVQVPGSELPQAAFDLARTLTQAGIRPAPEEDAP